MFSSRKLLEPPSKRGTGQLAMDATGVPHELSQAKRQRLDLWATATTPVSTMPPLPTASSVKPASRRAPPQRMQSLEDIENDNVLVQTPACLVSRVRAAPAFVSEEIRRERPSARQVVNCRVVVPTNSASTLTGSRRGERHVLSYYVLALHQRVVLWKEGAGNHVITLSLPEEIAPEEPLYPFLFALYGARVSLMVVGRSGRVLFWEDIELPYESVPLSVQIPLQPNEQVATNAHASLTVSPSSSYSSPSPGNFVEDQELKSVLCWSNLGSVWEIAMEDRRIRVRALERQQGGGFFSGITKTVSSFFFASSSSSGSAASLASEIDVQAPIQAVKIVPTASGSDADEDTPTVNKLVLFANGTLERRSFNSADAMDCNSTTVWHFDANRAAIAYFSEHFPQSHLAKVFMVSIPYIVDAATFGVVVAYVCTARNEDTPRVKYALFHFKASGSAAPEAEWACVLDYEPVFSETVDRAEYFDIETIAINNSAFYLVWVQSQPIHFAAIQLPAPGQTRVRSSGFSLQGVERNAALGFAPRVEVSSEASDAVKGSVSFLLMDFESLSSSGGGLVCAATASNMTRVYNKTATIDSSRRTKRVEDADGLTPESHTLGENLSVQEYASLLLSHFQEESSRASGGPFRITSRDVASVAQAAVGVAFQILDAKASSGLRWGKEANEQFQSLEKQGNGAIVTPKLVRFQLEEKRTRFEEFVAFIKQKCNDVWHCIESSEELLQYLVDGEEKLHAAVALCKFQGSISALEEESAEAGVKPKLTGQFLLRAIERAVHQRGYEKEQLRLAGYNAFDIFYCEVSKINEIFVALSAEIQKLASESGEGNADFLYALLESGYSMQSLLKTPTATQLASTGNWMFTRPIREAIADQISRLSSASGYSPASNGVAVVASPEEVFEIADQTFKLGSLLLDAYRRFIPVTTGEAADDLRKEADITKRLTLNPLVYIATDYDAPQEFTSFLDEGATGWPAHKKSELFVRCVKLAEEYAYYEAMVFLAYREDEENVAKLDYVLGRLEKSTAAKRLDGYCRKIPDFAEFAYRWYGGEAARYPWVFDGESARAQMFSYFLANSTTLGPSLHVYLKAHPLLAKYAWVTATASEKYDHVAHLTLREASGEQQSLAKRKTMASIAKIAALAGPATPVTTSNEIKRELNVARIQEVLMELPVDTDIDAEPLQPADLAAKSLEAMRSIAPEDPLRVNVFLIAIEALECLPAETTEDEFDTYCVRVWRECVLADAELWSRLLEENESGVNELKVEALMRTTLLFHAMVRYAASWQETTPATRSAGLTVDMVDDMVSREVSGSASDSLINVRSRQLLVKTLHLSRTDQ